MQFPEVFAGKTNIDAKSTTVIRCILSMENELQELLVLNPQLQIRHDASNHDMYYMNQTDTVLEKQKMPADVRKVYDAFCAKHDNYNHVMSEIFNDDDYWKNKIKNGNVDMLKRYYCLSLPNCIYFGDVSLNSKRISCLKSKLNKQCL